MRIYKNLPILTAALLVSTASYSAQLVDLKNQKSAVLTSFVAAPHARGVPSVEMREVSRFTDFNHTQHVRMQEYYRGYSIWNAHAVIHVADAKNNHRSLSQLLTVSNQIKSMNGQLYQNLETDLDKASDNVLKGAQADHVTQFAIDVYKAAFTETLDINLNNTTSQLLIFVDQNNTAHWAYKINIDIPAGMVGRLPAKPTYIIDALSLKIYQQWDDIKTAAEADAFVQGGGFGGNPRIGKLSYDGLPGSLSSFEVRRDAARECYLENNAIKVTHAVTQGVMHYPCKKKSREHNNLYWSGDFDSINQGYSPANDAMFIANLLTHFYKEWYGMPVLVHEDGSEMQLHMVVHENGDGAFWSAGVMHFADGINLYPFTSLSMGAHEVSHGFTEQHSGLIYVGQSGGMNEAFSDMAAKAAEFYAYNENDWRLGAEIFKLDDESLRYMDVPSKDCFGKIPGTHCSIDNAKQYFDGLDVHYSSGVYNRAFYLLSTSPGWDTRKAFEVMVQANASYWTPTTAFADGAACVVKAAKDLHYDVAAVKRAFKEVGVKPDTRCTNL